MHHFNTGAFALPLSLAFAANTPAFAAAQDYFELVGKPQPGRQERRLHSPRPHLRPGPQSRRRWPDTARGAAS